MHQQQSDLLPMVTSTFPIGQTTFVRLAYVGSAWLHVTKVWTTGLDVDDAVHELEIPSLR